jgi:hypothetical protein
VPNFNLLSALQQAKNSVASNMGKTLGQTQGYMSQAKNILQNVIVSPKWTTQKSSNVPSGMQDSFNQATQDFSPLAMDRAKNIKINVTPLKTYQQVGNPLTSQSGTEFGPISVLGAMPRGAAGVYSGGNSGRGEINVDPKYMEQMPSILRHELIHSMDSKINFGRPTSFPDKLSGPDGEPSQKEFEESIARDNSLTNSISILEKYLSGMGLIDSNNFYNSVSPKIQSNIQRATNGPLYAYNGQVHPRTLDIEGLAYTGDSGPYAYQLPQIRSIINPRSENSAYGTVVPNSGGQAIQLKSFKGTPKKK